MRRIGDEKRHDDGLDRILKDHSIIGMDNIVYVSKEVKIYNGKDLIREVDVMGYDAVHGHFMVENKLSNCYKGKAKKQLRTSLERLKEVGVIDDAVLLYVHSNMKRMERIAYE